MRFATILVPCVLLALASAAAGDETKAPPYDPRKAHAEADANGDGALDRAEFHSRMVEVFFFADSDRDGYMTWVEVEKSVAFPDDLRGADTNGDERISLHEFVRVRFADFDTIDSNHDGLLSVDEVVVVYERGGVR